MCCYTADVKKHSSGASHISGVSLQYNGVLDALEIQSLKLQGAECALRPCSMAESLWQFSGRPEQGPGCAQLSGAVQVWKQLNCRVTWLFT